MVARRRLARRWPQDLSEIFRVDVDYVRARREHSTILDHSCDFDIGAMHLELMDHCRCIKARRTPDCVERRSVDHAVKGAGAVNGHDLYGIPSRKINAPLSDKIEAHGTPRHSEASHDFLLGAKSVNLLEIAAPIDVPKGFRRALPISGESL
jgi:hypothetical protein